MTNILLKVTGLKVSYGGIQAVKGVDFEVREGELVSLIGSNGAGKTTTMKAITGILPINAGDIEYRGQSIRGQGPWDLVKQGLAMVPEGRGVFTRMSILENLQMGAYVREDAAAIEDDIDKVFGIFPRLQRARQATRWHAQRGRAADARYGARPDEPAPSATDGRALDGLVAADG